MNKIDYQALREAAEKATKGQWTVEFDDEIYSTDGVNHEQIATVLSENESRDAAFIAAASPATVLALLDELERNQQYIKNLDQENEDIALTVGKLRVKLEAAEMRIAELESLTAPRLTQPAVVGEFDIFTQSGGVKVAVKDGVTKNHLYGMGWNACRAAMIQGSKPETDNTNQQFESLSRGDK